MKTGLLVSVGLVALAGVGAYLHFGGGCGSCPLSGETKTTMTSVALPTTAPVLAVANVALAATADTGFKIDNVHSSVLYGILHQNVARHWGRFTGIAGTFHVDPANTSASMIDITVKTDSIDSGNKGRDEHLKGGDFFSAKEFPDITFKSASFEKKSDTMLECTGSLTLMGKAKTVTFPVEFLGKGSGRGGSEVSGFESKLTIKRSDFGMSGMMGMLGDDVQLIISCEGGR